jgi:hypothetical protein
MLLLLMLLLLLLLLRANRFVEAGLKHVGKDFNAVSRIVGSSKTVADTVEFYYNWKYKDAAYAEWVKARKLVSTLLLLPLWYGTTLLLYYIALFRSSAQCEGSVLLLLS